MTQSYIITIIIICQHIIYIILLISLISILYIRIFFRYTLYIHTSSLDVPIRRSLSPIHILCCCNYLCKVKVYHRLPDKHQAFAKATALMLTVMLCLQLNATAYTACSLQLTRKPLHSSSFSSRNSRAGGNGRKASSLKQPPTHQKSSYDHS